jgi:phenol 2-monooxygenase
LGWKIASVVKGYADRSILKTYQSERRRIAQDLIAFDHRFSRLFSGRPARDVADEEGISMEEFQNAFEKGNLFASGIAVDYGSSVIVAKGGNSAEEGDGTDVGVKNRGLQATSKQHLATNIRVGMRLPSFKVLNQADARPWHFQELLKSNGRWRLVIFAGDLTDQSQSGRLAQLGQLLAAPTSFIRRYTPTRQAIDSVIEILLVHSSPRTKIELLDLPEIFHPWSEHDGWDYWKVFVDDLSYHEGHGEAYRNYGVDPKAGCAVIVRPDQYVSWVGAVDEYEDMDKFFSAFMKPQVL